MDMDSYLGRLYECLDYPGSRIAASLARPSSVSSALVSAKVIYPRRLEPDLLSVGKQMLITARQLYKRLRDSSLVVLDCRFELSNPNAGRSAYATGHVPNALYIDLEDDLSAPVNDTSGRHPLPSIDAISATLGRLGVTRQTSVVVYDAVNSGFAARAWFVLKWLGHKNAAVLDGGLAAWVAEGYELTREVRAVKPVSHYPADVKDDWVVRATAIEANLESKRFHLIDARGADRFSGASEPIDPVAGHVPGAFNRPFTENLTESGHFKRSEALRQEWEATGLTGEMVMMCGSGVTACHHLLAREVAGLKAGRLYAGSWSEWITDSSRPVALG
ncbi:MAG: sulfurtransferase [Pseudomonadota bacterium]